MTADSHASLVSLQQLRDSSNDARVQSMLSVLQEAAGDTQWSLINNKGFKGFGLDSRHITDGMVFVALKSHTQHDDNKSFGYLAQAAKTAAFIITEALPTGAFTDEAAMMEALTALPCPVLYVPTIRMGLGSLIQAHLQAKHAVTLPRVVAVTGTNGKTTVSQIVAQLMALAGSSSAVMGTAGNGRLGALKQASHTTGDARAVQQFLYDMGSEGADILALEASSHGLDQARLQGVPVQVAIYTNLSRDHLDYHSDMDDYARAKAKLFDRHHFPELTHAIINSDDAYSHVMQAQAQAGGVTVWTYSLHDNQASFYIDSMTPSLDGVQLRIHSPFGALTVHSPLLGKFNVANLLAALAAVAALGADIEALSDNLEQLKGATGRMQRVASQDGCFIIDYAHTPDALTQVLSSLKTHCDGKLWAVFGCGGDRDAGKRPLMAQAGLEGADCVVLTADNPRSEDPKAILDDMQVGMSAAQYERTHIEPERARAIEYAICHAGADDIVVIAGKGHETYQEICGVRHDFDDHQVVAQLLERFGRA
ncbi:UDP-N-acetylmuramoyl-L-alanyl-D-glutamate--2,6-diaminopimelate ligase [Psychrobacter aestuarii]|uniref:UDP-N-acetylmuramoyl-L-alanyl-D-glutamate--2,6-diaminopimelate ligase n=1 Tax=Psychrobacter aestuarii TaxID=556327 RepID=A0ABP3FAF4_9GAMM|nr:UDP-N-acetylmuramoyl-L-alanyl-D-glutamate--2,6-diaminopimelate ligase [Psychrobacter aestuarii]